MQIAVTATRPAAAKKIAMIAAVTKELVSSSFLADASG
jgi:hypothetical protein